MATVTGFLGLCGSGKSTLAHQMSGVEVFDESFFDKLPDLIAALRAGKDCAITEIAFCQNDKREWLQDLLKTEVPGTIVDWKPIEKDLDKANQNCRRPERKADKPDYNAEAHVRMNSIWLKRYEYPKGVPVLKMWPYADPGPVATRAT